MELIILTIDMPSTLARVLLHALYDMNLVITEYLLQLQSHNRRRFFAKWIHWQRHFQFTCDLMSLQ